MAVAAGAYSIGAATETDDDPGFGTPEHSVHIAAFDIARFPVTNAEWGHFVAAGGYDDERWWPTDAARSWRAGVGTAHGSRVLPLVV